RDGATIYTVCPCDCCLCLALCVPRNDSGSYIKRLIASARAGLAASGTVCTAVGGAWSGFGFLMVVHVLRYSAVVSMKQVSTMMRILGNATNRELTAMQRCSSLNEK